MSGSAQNANVNLPVVAGGFLPGAVVAGTRAENVQGCSALAVDPAASGYWAITLNRPIQALKAVVLCSEEGDIGVPPLSSGPVFALASETVVNIYSQKIAGSINRNQGISFLVLEVPNL